MRGCGPAEPRARADHVEGRAARARELTGARHELAGVDAGDRPRQLSLECRQLRRA